MNDHGIEIQKRAISAVEELKEKAFESYFGGKEGEGVYQFLINHIPECDTFIEVFGGNYAVSRKLADTCDKWVNDVDPQAYEAYLTTIHSQMTNYSFSNVSYQALFSALVNSGSKYGRIVVFLDPPYRKEARKSQKDVYNFEWTDGQHKEFFKELQVLRRARPDIKFMLTHYPDEMYERVFSKWYRASFESQTRQGKALEYMWLSYDRPDRLQDYQYLGENFTRRQNLKRKNDAWVDAINEESVPVRRVMKFFCTSVTDQLAELTEGIVLSKDDWKRITTKTSKLLEMPPVFRNKIIQKVKSDVMVNETKFQRSYAEQVASQVTEAIREHTDLTVVVGSIRRGKSLVSDVDIVCIPKQEEIPNGMFDTQSIRSLGFNKAIKGLPGLISDPSKLPTAKQINFHREDGIKIQIWCSDRAEFYRMMAIRTGSADFVTKYISGGWSRKGWVGVNGVLRLRSECIFDESGRFKGFNVQNPSVTPEWKSEQKFFEWLGLSWAKYGDPKNREA